ncbi:MAG: cytochrome c oxidase assembly protein [Gemmatimonadota bacterium]|jgi:putative membrane protein|nr:cytochrome c oxidase assembly protein [Gemmatimonadota bacterium]MDQ8157745.1 cytochrome c oxidase assembly protein [Gemmatimonadota bacterium]MDQ8170853.1 cytochrome c oxidase assembly protein [Gemmatimonadota bacterium]
MRLVLFLHPRVDLAQGGFTVHWSTVIGLLALWAVYQWRAAVHRRRDGQRLSVGRQVSVAAGLLAMFLTLNGPIHDISDYYLFTGHMVQHLVLTFVTPPLLLLGVPGWMLRPALAHPGVAAVARWVTVPRTAFALFNLVLAVWHLPPLYNSAMFYHPVHITQHLMFLVTAVIVWWPLLSPLPELPRLSYPGQMLYSFLLTLPMTIVSIFIVYADHVLYPAYASAPRLWGLSPLEDQRLGGLLMWIPGGLFFYGLASVIFFRWSTSQRDDRAGAQVHAA